MTTYAPVPAYAEHNLHPRALLLIAGAHAALLAAVIMAKPELVTHWIPNPTTVTLIPQPKEPPENPPPPQPSPRQPSSIDHPKIEAPIPQPSQPEVESTPLPIPDLDPIPVDPGPATTKLPPQPVRAGPRFITPDYDVKPPYPQSKLRDGQEAVLRLRLSIDARGRVTAVEPVGSADPVFLAAARRHLIAHWRYKPATEDGRPVATSTVISLTFRLE